MGTLLGTKIQMNTLLKAVAMLLIMLSVSNAQSADVDTTVNKALGFLEAQQKRQGYWEAEQGA